MNCGKGIVFADWSHHENICEGGSSYHAPCIDEDQSTSVIIGDSDEELPDNCGNACATVRDSQSLSIKVDSSHNDSSKLLQPLILKKLDKRKIQITLVSSCVSV